MCSGISGVTTHQVPEKVIGVGLAWDLNTVTVSSSANAGRFRTTGIRRDPHYLFSVSFPLSLSSTS
ncbi:hypothetical protein ACNKHP_18485 [Shigella boydii]